MDGCRLDEGLGRSAPDGDQATGLARFFEVADVLAKLLGQIHLVLALLDVGAVNFFDVVVIEDGLHGRDGAETAFHFVEEIALEDSGIAGGGVHVVFEDVPSGEDEIVEAGEWNEFVDLGRAPVGALAEADRTHLGERSDGVGDSLPHGFDARDESCCHGAHAWDHDAQFSFGWFDGVAFMCGWVVRLTRETSLRWLLCFLLWRQEFLPSP